MGPYLNADSVYCLIKSVKKKSNTLESNIRNNIPGLISYQYSRNNTH